MTKNDPCGWHQKGDGSWWARDSAGIELCRVCDKCEEIKLGKYNQRIFTSREYAVTGSEEYLMDGIDEVFNKLF